jgi:hypothetical protein
MRAAVQSRYGQGCRPIMKGGMPVISGVGSTAPSPRG